MKKFLAVILAVLAVSLFAITVTPESTTVLTPTGTATALTAVNVAPAANELVLTWKGSAAMTFTYTQDGTLTYSESLSATLEGFNGLKKAPADFYVKVNLLPGVSITPQSTTVTTPAGTTTALTNVSASIAPKVLEAYVIYSPVKDLTLKFGKVGFTNYSYNTISRTFAEAKPVELKSTNRITASYNISGVQLSGALMSSDKMPATDLAKDWRVKAGTTFGPVSGAVSYDMTKKAFALDVTGTYSSTPTNLDVSARALAIYTSKLDVYALSNVSFGNFGLVADVLFDVSNTKISDGMVGLTADIAPVSAEFYLDYAGLVNDGEGDIYLSAAVEFAPVKVEASVESTTKFDGVAYSVAASIPYQLTTNVKATPKVAYDSEKGFAASLKFAYEF